MNALVRVPQRASEIDEKTDRQRSQLVRLLTENQRTVLTMMADGFSNEEIATYFKITGKGVEWYHTEIFRKLKLPYGGSMRKRMALAIKALHYWQTSEASEVFDTDSVVDIQILQHERLSYKEDAARLIKQGYRLERATVTFVLRKN